MLRWGCCLVFGLALLGPPLGAQERQALVGFDYRVHYWPPRVALARVVADTAADALPRLRRALGAGGGPRVEIYLVRSADEFRALSGGADPFRVLGLALWPERRIVLQPVREEELRPLVVHELTHVMLEEALQPSGGEVPRWLHEGLAKYAANEFTPGDRMLLTEAVNRGTLLPQGELEQAFGGSPEKVALAYAEAATLVAFLARREPTQGLAPLLRQLAQVGEVDRAILRAYGLTPEQLAREWRAAVLAEYLGRSNWDWGTVVVWAAMTALFGLVVVLRRRHSVAIRRRLEAEESILHLTWEARPARPRPQEESDEPSDLL